MDFLIPNGTIRTNPLLFSPTAICDVETNYITVEGTTWVVSHFRNLDNIVEVLLACDGLQDLTISSSYIFGLTRRHFFIVKSKVNRWSANFL